jgi:aspartyl aminopeptidase
MTLYGYEEVGSNSRMGAGSKFLGSVAARKSFLVSADMAHGMHPNYSEEHEVNHAAPRRTRTLRDHG